MKYLLECETPEDLQILTLYPHHHKGYYVCLKSPAPTPYPIYGAGYGPTLQEAIDAAVASAEVERGKQAERIAAAEAYRAKNPKPSAVNISLEDLGL